MRKLNWTYRILSFVLLNLILLSSPTILLSQPIKLGIISVFSEGANNERVVKINGNTAISEQTIISPSVIETPFNGMRLRVVLNKAGRINFDSDTKMNLAFGENKISGSLLRGGLTVLVEPNTTLNVQTNDGVITVASQNQETNLVINFVDGKTQVKTLSGLAKFNENSIASGQSFIFGQANVSKVDLLDKSTLLFYIIVPIEITIQSFLGDTNDSKIDNNQTNVGPIK